MMSIADKRKLQELCNMVQEDIKEKLNSLKDESSLPLEKTKLIKMVYVINEIKEMYEYKEEKQELHITKMTEIINKLKECDGKLLEITFQTHGKLDDFRIGKYWLQENLFVVYRNDKVREAFHLNPEDIYTLTVIK